MLQLPTEHALWVVEYGEPNENELAITLVEAKVSVDVVETELGPANSVYPDRSCSVFRVRWTDYVAFVVRNESFALPDGSPLGYGLGTKAHSRFRTYVAASTFADDNFPGVLTHWYLNAERHCFDIMSLNAPVVSRLNAEETAAVLDRYL